MLCCSYWSIDRCSDVVSRPRSKLFPNLKKRYLIQLYWKRAFNVHVSCSVFSVCNYGIIKCKNRYTLHGLKYIFSSSYFNKCSAATVDADAAGAWCSLNNHFTWIPVIPKKSRTVYCVHYTRSLYIVRYWCIWYSYWILKTRACMPIDWKKKRMDHFLLFRGIIISYLVNVDYTTSHCWCLSLPNHHQTAKWKFVLW